MSRRRGQVASCSSRSARRPSTTRSGWRAAIERSGPRGGRGQGARRGRHRDPARHGRPHRGDDRLGRAISQRRDEGPHHRPRGAQHPRPRAGHGHRPDHRRHARVGAHQRLRPGPPRDRAAGAHQAHPGRPHPSRPHRGGRRQGEGRGRRSLIRQAGEAAAYETGVPGLPPEIIKLLGRLRYRTSYGQNVLKHSIETARLAAVIAAEIGADIQIAKTGRPAARHRQGRRPRGRRAARGHRRARSPARTTCR